MNNSSVLTIEKILVTFRLDPEIYDRVREKVYLKKSEKRGYSINEYLTEMVVRDYKGKK